MLIVVERDEPWILWLKFRAIEFTFHRFVWPGSVIRNHDFSILCLPSCSVSPSLAVSFAQIGFPNKMCDRSQFLE